ncbi:RIMS-binding protein 2-like isoform X2 [Tubulanus polymorphus]|uniref:RIMS-binding protein 2-like isoform X2 n=1 Tax=Tubulanus polymorphus TaxID=672921 RepID=UPI003DA69C51
MRQAAMERLRLERQVAINSVSSSSQVQNEEVSPQTLQEEIKNLHEKLKERDKLEKEIQAKRSECEHLIAQKELQNQNLNKLENDLQLVSEEKTQLAVENSDLHQQIIQIEKVNDECKLLRDKLSTAEQESVSAKSDVNTLQDKVANLEALLFHYRESADKRKQLEDEHQEALTELHQKQEEVQHLHKVQDDIKKEHEDTIESLQVKLRELERKCELQAIKHDELSLELTSLKKQSKNASTSSIEIQTDQDAASKLDSALLPRMSPKRRQRDVDSVWDINSIHSDRSLRPSDSTIGTIKSTDTEKEKKDKILKSKLSLGDKSVIPPVLLNKGHVKIFVAKYSYDPVSYSPNENPEAELSLNAGDYVMVSGDVDEDGFYEGELMDGRKGLVPSNFVAEVPDEDLDDFHATLALGGKSDETSSIGSSFQHDLDFNSSDESEKMATELPEDMQRVRRLSEHLSDLEDIEEVDEDNIQTDRSSDINSTGEGGSLKRTKGQKNIPCPRKLTLDRQLTNSILIGWAPPDVANPGDIQAYHIYVDGQFKTSVKGTERTRALVEGVTSTKSHRVCVRTVLARGQSKDQECTITIGKESTFAPSNMKSSNITATSAHISWWPGNSNYQHVIYLNDKEYRILRPGVYKIVLTDLSPNAQYKVTVRAKSLKAPFDEEKNLKKMEFMSSAVEFHTLPGGLPDAPLDLQVEAGPQDGMLLATWLPVTINAVGTSNGALVTGYAVYVDGVKMKEVNSPTADHVILDASHLRFQIPHACALTVRTLAGNKESKDSVPSKLPHADTTPTSVKKNSVPTTGLINGSTDVNEEPNPEIKPQFPDEMVDSSHSELSDIAEVEEETDMSDLDKRRIDLDKTPVALFAEPPIKVIDGPRIISKSPIQQVTEVPLSYRPDKLPTKLTADNKTSLGIRTSPHGAESEENTPVITPPIHMTVPHIEITKDSSLSNDGNTDDDTDNHSYYSNSPASPRSPRSPKSPEYTAYDYSQRGLEKVQHGAKKTDFENNNKQEKRVPHSPKNVEKTSSSPASPRSRGGSARSRNSRPNSARDESIIELESNDMISPKKIRDDIPESELIDYEDDGTESLAEIDIEYDESNSRLYIALFDYDPISMSPNPETADEELPFKEGQLIKIYGDKDADGFYQGEANGRLGYVPYNMVSEVQLDDPELAKQLLNDSDFSKASSALSHDHIQHVNGQSGSNHRYTSQSPRHSKEHSPRSQRSSREHSTRRSPNRHTDDPIRKMIALYDYDPQELSPNVDSEVELAFRTGDIVYVYGDMDEDGFYYGEMNGIQGLVPSNFLQEVPVDEEELFALRSSDSRPQSEGSKSGDKSQESSAVEESPKSETRSLEPADQVKNEKNNPPSPISTPPLVDDDRKRDKKGFKFNIFKKFSR